MDRSALGEYHSGMALLQPIGEIEVERGPLGALAEVWRNSGERFPKREQMALGKVFDGAVAAAVARMLGGIPVVTPAATAIGPDNPDCVELGTTRVVGGVRAQNFDVGYRPDGVRFAFDSKTLNDAASVRKNYQNMINDLATEATTVHTRFPYAVVAFLVAIPEPCLVEPQRSTLVATLERLSGRFGVDEPPHVAEAIALLLWDPADGSFGDDRLPEGSTLGLRRFARRIEAAYRERYKGLPPHVG